MTEPSVCEETGRNGTPSRSKRGSRDERQIPGMLEWAIGGVSAVVVAAMIGFLLYDALSGPSAFPDLHVIAEGMELRSGVYYVEFRALNRGEATAAGVRIEGALRDGKHNIESASAEIEYLPANSEREGALLFRNDPRRHQLQLEIKGYRSP